MKDFGCRCFGFEMLSTSTTKLLVVRVVSGLRRQFGGEEEVTGADWQMYFLYIFLKALSMWKCQLKVTFFYQLRGIGEKHSLQ